MSERQYTVAEIDRMRRAIEMGYPTGVAYYPQERSAEVENRLRTYIQNGTAPEELDEVARAQMEVEFKMQERLSRSRA